MLWPRRPTEIFLLHQNSLSNNVRRFSTGLRIESAKDDATGLAISERFRSQIKGYETANQNAQDANNMLQVADGALNENPQYTSAYEAAFLNFCQ